MKLITLFCSAILCGGALLAAPLADNVFKPAMLPGGVLARIFGPLIGVGANHGIGLLISFLGLLAVIVSIVAFGSPYIRNLERDLPDHAAGLVSEAPVAVSEPTDY